MALLGALLANNKAFDKVAEFLRPEHFADERHGRIFDACAKLIQRGTIANPVTLKNYFEQDNTLADIGGAQYLARLAGSVVTVINAVDYARTIHDLFLRRQLINIGEEIINNAYSYDLETTAAQQIEAAEQKLFELAKSGEYEGGFRRFGEALAVAIDMAEQAYKRDSHVTGVTTGLDDLDKKLGGLHPSDLIVLAGRPSMGKTALATKIAFSAAAATATGASRKYLNGLSLGAGSGGGSWGLPNWSTTQAKSVSTAPITKASASSRPASVRMAGPSAMPEDMAVT